MSAKAVWLVFAGVFGALPGLAEEDPNSVDTEFLEFLGSWERGDAEMFQEIWDRELQEGESQTGKVDRDDEEGKVLDESDDPA
jgi:hypothetical protein